MLDKKQHDYFSSYMTGEEIMNKRHQEHYESRKLLIRNITNQEKY